MKNKIRENLLRMDLGSYIPKPYLVEPEPNDKSNVDILRKAFFANDHFQFYGGWEIGFRYIGDQI